MILMSEKIEELYQEYLREILDLIFESCVPIGKKGKMNFIDMNGKLISNDWYDNVRPFSEGYARVEKNYKLNFINTRGKLISDKWFDKIGDFHEGYAIVKENGKYNYIDTKGKLISDKWFDYMWDFHDGYANVEENGKYNCIDTKGKFISDKWLDYSHDFHEGYAIVAENGKYNFINTKNELISDKWFDDIWDFHEGYAIVRLNNLYNFIDVKGNFVSDIWFDNVRHFHDGYASVVIYDKNDNVKYNFINTKGNLLSIDWFDDVEFLDHDLSIINKNGKYNLINKKCKFLFDYSKDKSYKLFKNFVKFNGKVVCRNVEMGDYKVKKILFGYTCKNTVDSYKVKYMPIKRYGLRYTLCLNQNKVLLYDRISNQYTYEWKINDIEYDDNYIFDKKNEKVYFMYENQMIEITEYYNKYLKNKDIIKINSGVTGIISKDEFSFLNRDKIDEIFKEINEEKKKREELEKKEENKRKLEEMKVKRNKLDQERRNAKLEALENLKKSIQELSQFSDSSDKLPKMQIEEKDFLVKKEDHLEISPMYLDVLKFIDLKYISFDNVKVDGIDFSETNLIIDPQKVYQKNLKGCNFEKIYISPFMNFRGVDIRGCHFSEDNDPRTYDTFNITFKEAIYDETTTYNGISFEKILEEKMETVKNNK